MLSFIYKLYFVLKKRKHNSVVIRKINSAGCILMSKIANYYVKTHYKAKIKPIGINKEFNRDKKIIVSLTSFPGRIDHAWVTIESLLRQSYKPDKIILWLAEEQFEDLNNLPLSLLQQQQKGLDIRFCDDLKSHKKYYYTFLEYPHDLVITVDDDTIYPNNLLEELVNLNHNYPHCICCNNARIIQKNKNGGIASYNKWKKNTVNNIEPSKLLCPIGVGGVLYPPNSVNKEVFNKSSIKKFCLNADDLWLKAMSLKNNTGVVKSSVFPGEFFTIDSSQKEALSKSNVKKNKNDEQLKAILNNYNIELSD